MKPFDPWYFQRWAHQQKVGNPTRKLMLTALAMMVETNTGYCFASQDDLADYAECSKRSAVTHLQALEDDGYLRRRKRSAKWGRLPDGFLLLAPGIVAWPTGEPVEGLERSRSKQSAIPARCNPTSTQSATHVAQEQPLERPRVERTSSSPNAGVRTREQQEDQLRDGAMRVTHRSKAAKKSDLVLTSQLLDGWNSETGQHHRLVDGTGRPSQEFKRILGAVMAHPEIEPSRWTRTMNTVLANPYMDWGTPSVGVVFGPNVVGDNLENPARGANRQKRNGRPEVIRGSLKERNANLKDDIRRMESLDTG